MFVYDGSISDFETEIAHLGPCPGQPIVSRW